LVIFLGFAAVNTSNNLIYIIVSTLLGFIAVSGVFGKENLSKLEVDYELPGEMYAQKPFPVRITLRNPKKRMPAFLIWVVIQGQEVLFPFVDCGAEATAYLNLSFEHRGRYHLKGGYIYSVFPFSFITRFRTIRQMVEGVVFPEPKKCDIKTIYEIAQQHFGDHTLNRAGDSGDMMSVRGYQFGDPLRHINWKASAKTGDLKTKELSTIAFQPVTIHFEALNIPNIEERISNVTYIILQYVRKGVPIGLRIHDRLYPPNIDNSHKISMLTELALHGTETDQN